MRRRTLALVVLVGAAPAPPAAAQAISVERQIAASLLPLPQSLRDGATVIRWDTQQRPVTIRQGTNGMVCGLYVPGEAEFDARCYHQSFMPAIARMQQLVAERRGMQPLVDEIRAGQLKLPEHPTAGYRARGPARAYDPVANTATSEMQIWQSIHFPFRTAAEIGLPETSDLGEAEAKRRLPYVMSSGRFWSHVMINHDASTLSGWRPPQERQERPGEPPGSVRKGPPL